MASRLPPACITLEQHMRQGGAHVSQERLRALFIC